MVNTTSTPINLRNVTVTDKFWKNEMELVRNEVIPYQWNALNDKVEGAEPSYCMRNFKIAGKITAKRKELGNLYEEKIWPLDTFQTLPEDMEHMEDRFYGFLFQDSDFSKWIEAVGYSLTQHPDPELEAVADGAIDIVCAAQQENGYLDTYYIINDMSKVFTNLKDNHELYCFGHLTEGAVAYYQATKKDKLLNAAKRYADYVCTRFGVEDGKMKGYPGHEIAEMALVRLYEVTNDKKYLELSKFFLNERGTRPYYFDKEHPDEVKKHNENPWYHYYQAHLPVREQDEAVGHAVRAVYLYSGMADVARLTDDEKLYEACCKLWDNMVNKKMYITGGIGGTHIGEAFSFNYDLPNDTAYSETCAAIGLVFFARRMLQIDMDSKYADVMERALYNTVLSGMALDGKSFFYVNPLEVKPLACHVDARKMHVKPVRQKWFGCACCPPNIARLVSSVASYAYTENEDTLFMHLYVGGNVEKIYGKDTVLWNIRSELPWSGRLRIVCEKCVAEENNETDGTNSENGTNKKYAVKTDMINQNSINKKNIAVRIPDWCNNYTVKCDGFATEVRKGYVYITGDFKEGDEVAIDFDMPVKIMRSASAVVENQGKVAVTRGPIVYCIEETDNGADLHNVSLIPDASCAGVKEKTIEGEECLAIELPGKREVVKDTGLYSEYVKPEYEDITLTFIPYYTWANRGEGEMSVWVNADKK